VGSDAGRLERHPSLDERFDPAIRIVDHDPAWAAQAQDELRRLMPSRPEGATSLRWNGSGTSSCQTQSSRTYTSSRDRPNPQDRLSYIAAKDEYVRELEARAVQWARAI
jgi:GrpB-like predicted nucleotidyltransferase (UPF0157 family)